MVHAVATKLLTLAQILLGAITITYTEYANGQKVFQNPYLVTLNPESYSGRAYSAHAQFYRDLTSRGVNWTTVKEYRDPLFTGAVVELLSGTDLVRLTDIVGGEFVSLLRVQHAIRSTASAEHNLSERSRNGDPPWSHTLTGVDEVHAANFHGEGITIGIIDSGIDYTHPALGDGFGPGYKVIGGHDFVGDDFDERDDEQQGGPNPPQPDPDPLETCNGHGTKVAGILGTDPGLEDGMVGVAYGASINAYRVLSCRKGFREDIIIDALIRAYNDGNDIITISVEYGRSWRSPTTTAIIDRIASQGRIVTVALANDAISGPWSANYIGRHPRFIGVGSVARTMQEPYTPGAPRAYMADSSGIGPTSDMHLAAALSAPGEDVLSTVIGGGYELCSGASFAAPFVAGSIALWMQVKGKSPRSTYDARVAFQNTALPMELHEGPMIDTVARQGAGLIQVHRAIFGTSHMSPAELLLNDTMFAKLLWPIFIRNSRDELVRYRLTHLPSGTLETYRASRRLHGTPRFSPRTAKIDFSRPLIEVPARSTGAFRVTVRPPTWLHASHFPVYSGYIIATGSDGSTIRSAYLGLAASMKDIKLMRIYRISMLAPGQDREDILPTRQTIVYTMQGTGKIRLVLPLRMTTALLRLELVDASAGVRRVFRSGSSSRACGRLVRWMNDCASQVSLPANFASHGIRSDQLKVVGLLMERWDDGLIRWGGQRLWTETLVFTHFADGSEIPDGRYRLFLRVLKRYGNPRKESDYETWLGPEFVVKRS